MHNAVQEIPTVRTTETQNVEGILQDGLELQGFRVKIKEMEEMKISYI